MSIIITLKNIKKDDYQLVGFRGRDLGFLSIENVKMPLSFIITTEAYDKFLENNNLLFRIKRALSEVSSGSEARMRELLNEIRKLFLQGEFTKESREEILENYESLALDVDDIAAGDILDEEKKPAVNLISSPNYLMDHEEQKGVIQNISGEEEILRNIKLCYANLFDYDELIYREINDIGHDVKAAIILQQMPEAKASAYSYTSVGADNDIKVNALLGLIDFTKNISGDEFLFSREMLKLKERKVKNQEFRLTKYYDSEELVREYLQDEGKKQKVTDQSAEDAARMTKKVKFLMQNDARCFFYIIDGKAVLMFVDRTIDLAEKDAAMERFLAEKRIRGDSKAPDERPAEGEALYHGPAFSGPAYSGQENNKLTYPEEDRSCDIDSDEALPCKPEEDEIFIEDDSIPIEDDLEFLGEIESKITIQDPEEGHAPEDYHEPEDVAGPEEGTETEERKDGSAETGERTHEMMGDSDNDNVDDEIVDSIVPDVVADDVVPNPDADAIVPYDVASDSVSDVAADSDETAEKQGRGPGYPKASDDKPVIKQDEVPQDEMDGQEVFDEISKNILVLDKTIHDLLRKKYRSVIEEEPPDDFSQTVDRLSTRINVPLSGGIKEVHKLKKKFQEKGSLSVDEISYAMQIAEDFVSEFSNNA